MNATKADPQRAFRAGFGVCALESEATDGAHGVVRTAIGPNEAVFLAMRRLPGSTDPRAAFENGRALRILARLLDAAGAPARVGEQFRDNLVAAAIAHASRNPDRPWRAEDTVAMFLELYRRVLAPSEADCARLERRLLSWVREELRPLPACEPRPVEPRADAAFRLAA